MTSLDQNNGVTILAVPTGQLLTIQLDDASNFKQRSPEQYEAIIECSALVNQRRTEIGEPPILVLG